MSGLNRGGTAESVSRDRILRRERGQGKKKVSCPADDEQVWQPYPVDRYSAENADHTYTYEKEWMGCFLDDLRAFGINADQWTTAAQDEEEWRRTVEQGAEHFMAK